MGLNCHLGIQKCYCQQESTDDKHTNVLTATHGMKTKNYVKQTALQHLQHTYTTFERKQNPAHLKSLHTQTLNFISINNIQTPYQIRSDVKACTVAEYIIC